MFLSLQVESGLHVRKIKYVSHGRRKDFFPVGEATEDFSRGG